MGWTVHSSRALPLQGSIRASPTTTSPAYQVNVEIPKPTYTFTPSPTLPPTAEPTLTAEPLVLAEILPDTPTPESLELPTYQPADSSSYAVSNDSGYKRILVDISDQHMYVYERDRLVYSFVSSTGMNNSTRVGSFSVLNKIPNAYGETWNIWMPNWLGIYWSGNLQNGIHALPILPNGAQLWAGYLGVPISYGCVVIGSYEAQLLYDWAEIGTTVQIQW
ncbi:MAG: L,D-transpeptidase [Deltaproteobacteria bacterium]|nr:L,D-transpeptidase [Deltaproteobacteria bacterium]